MPVATTPAIPTALPGADEAVARYGELGRTWLEAMWRGDPLADGVAADGAGLVRRAIAEGIDALDDPPAPLGALFAELDSPPSWMDRDRCDRAAISLGRQAGEYGVVLGAASLVSGAQNTIASKPLTFTGRYASNAAVRSLEVGSWLTAVTTPGGLGRYAAGFERTVRVRMIHAHVRKAMLRKPDWDNEAWGEPIPQPFMAFTLAEFCSIAVRAMAQLGVRYSDGEIEDIHHLWRCVGHLVGVEKSLLPIDAPDYERIEDLYALTSPGPEDENRAFIVALTEFQAAELGRLLPRRMAPVNVIHGLQRAFVGDRVADQLALPRTRWERLPRVIGPIAAAGYATYDRVVPNGRSRRTARAFRRRAEEETRMRRKYGLDHDLVDAAA